MQNIVLFDIDGTLVNIFKYHSSVYESISKEIWGVDVSYNLEKCSGNSIVCNLVQVLGDAGISEKDVFAKMPIALEMITGRLKEKLSCGISECILPGVPQLLAHLKKNDIPMGITTGNSRDVGKLILESAGLADYFEFGAFADEVGGSLERRCIVELAIKRASMIEGQIGDVFVVGDTPQDILSAKSAKAESIAVATGLHKIDELKTYSPNYLFDSFKDYNSVVDIISGSRAI